jgi:hypothetical protein
VLAKYTSRVFLVVLCLVAAAGIVSAQQDNWNGGTGLWSVAGNWSAGVPMAANDVLIYSGGADSVTLDINSVINSLTLGGINNGFSSQLDVTKGLNVTKGLTVGTQGTLLDNSSVLTGTITNSGSVTIANGAVLNLNNQPGGVTTVAADSVWTIVGNFQLNGVANAGFQNLSDVMGTVNFQNGQAQTISPAKNVLTLAATGLMDLSEGTSLLIKGDVNNDGAFTLSTQGAGNDRLTITGTLGNTGVLQLSGAGDMATIAGAVVNDDIVIAQDGSDILITNDVTNSGAIKSGSNNVGGNSITITGLLMNLPDGSFQLFGAKDTATLGSLENFPEALVNVDATGGATLTILGNADNFAAGAGEGIFTGLNGNGGNTLKIGGMLTNEGMFQVNGPGDRATVGSLINNAGGTVDVEGGKGATLTVSGDVENSAMGGGTGIFTSEGGTGGNRLLIGGKLTNSGDFELKGPNDQATVGGNVNNTGTITFTDSMAMFLAALDNSGTLDLENGGGLQVAGAASNSGTLSTNSAGLGGGNTMTFTGLLTNTATGMIVLNGKSDKLTASGGMANTGMISVKNGSTVDPPVLNNLGSINIDNTSQFVVGTGAAQALGYVQLANGTLGEMISKTAFGTISVNGPASLDGTLDILLQGGFNPAVGATYNIILFSPNGLTGIFATIQNQVFNGGSEQWVVNYNNGPGNVQLEVVAVKQPTPEPSSFLLLGTGLLGLACGVRWRRVARSTLPIVRNL